MTFLTDQKFNTGPLVIGTALQFILAHGLTVVPSKVSLVLTNIVPEFGFILGDQTLGRMDTNTVGFIVDALNVKITYRNKANVFKITDPLTGAGLALTNANWTAEFTFS